MSTSGKYTAQAIADAMGVNRTTIVRRAKKEKWPFKEKAQRGGRLRLYAPADLPESAQDVRMAIGRVEAEKLGGAVAAANVPAVAGIKAVPPDWAYKPGMAKFRIVEAYQKHLREAGAFTKGGRRGRKRVRRSVEIVKFCEMYNAGAVLPELREAVPEISHQSLYRWMKQLQEADGDVKALCDKRGAWRSGGPKGLGQIGAEAEGIFLNYYLRGNRPSLAMAYRLTAHVLKAAGKPVPSYASVRRFLQRYEEEHYDLVILKREGEKALADHVDHYITRDRSQLNVGDVLVADGKVLNFNIINPSTGKGCRMILVLWLDEASRYPVGWEIMPTENTQAISNAFRRACMNLGRAPKRAYLDNGRAFKAKFFTKTDPDLGELEGLYARLGTGLITARPYNGRAKIVERFFRTFDQQFEILVDSYRGRNIDNKPAVLKRNEKYHRERHSGYTPTLEHAYEMVAAYLHWYANSPHEGIGGAMPAELFEPGRTPLSREQLEDLNRFFLWRQEVMPQRCRISLPGIPLGFESDTLHGLKKTIMAMYDPQDLRRVFLYDLDGTPIGEAKPVEAVHAMVDLGTELDAQKLKEQTKKQRDQRKRTMRLAKELDARIEDLGVAANIFQKERKPLEIVVSNKPEDVKRPEPPRAEPSDTEKEKEAELQALYEKIKAEQDLPKPKKDYQVPDHMWKPYDKYLFLFKLIHRDGVEPREEDARFMREYEASDEYKFTRGTFEHVLAGIKLMQQGRAKE